MESNVIDVYSEMDKIFSQEQINVLVQKSLESSKEKETAFKTLKELVSQCPNSKKIENRDDMLHRYLVARSLNPQKAFEMIQNTMKWREELKVDGILLEPQPKEYQRMCPHAFYGVCKEGRPIYWDFTGKVNLPKLLEILTQEDVLRRHIWSMEKQLVRMRRAMSDRKYLIDKHIMILDLSGLSMRPDTRGITIFKELIQIDQNHYPEMLGHMFIINTGWFFQSIWALLSPWIDPNTAQKFHILGSNYIDKFRELIDDDQIPREFGGTADITLGEWTDDDLDFVGGDH